jgi:hypothetical protein
VSLARGVKRESVNCVCSAGFYAENLLLYSEQARNEGLLPLPVGENHKFAPVALGVSNSAAKSQISADLARTSPW